MAGSFRVTCSTILDVQGSRRQRSPAGNPRDQSVTTFPSHTSMVASRLARQRQEIDISTPFLDPYVHVCVRPRGMLYTPDLSNLTCGSGTAGEDPFGRYLALPGQAV